MGFDFHELDYRITSIRRMVIGMGNHRPICENGSLHSIERWKEESYRCGQNLHERSMEISLATIEHSVRSGL
jgi:hypothetical protein